MKSIFKLSILTFFAGLFFSACDVIDDPIKDGGARPIDTSSTTVLRKIVIEDFTGHICKNCPDAAKVIKTLQATYGEQIIGIALHAGPSNFTGVTADYPEDFTTPEGTEIYSFFKIPALPMGMVNRVDYSATGTSHLKTFGSWPTQTANMIDDIAKFDIKATSSFETATGNYTVTVDVEALEDHANDLNYVVMLLESGIVGPQLMPDNTRNPDYVFDHTLRQTITAALGNELTSGGTALGTIINKQIGGTIDPTWVPENCHVVVYVNDAVTQEILQAEEISLK